MGQLEDRFDLEPPLHRGQVASVYPARQKGLDRKVLLKIIHPHLTGDAELRARFIREGKAIAQVNHPNVVKIFEQGEIDGTLYLALEWVEGGTLADRIQAGPLDQAEVKYIAECVLKGLAAVHQQGLIHRDLKPDNILVNMDGRALLTDFSLAGFAHSSNLTGHGVLIGSPAYFAPELIDGAPASRPSDLWAVGVILLEALTGSNPFYNPDPILTLDLVRRVNPPKLTGHPAIDTDLARLTDALLEREVQARPATAEEALDILQRNPSLPVEKSDDLGKRKSNSKFWWSGLVAALILIIIIMLKFTAVGHNELKGNANADVNADSSSPSITIESNVMPITKAPAVLGSAIIKVNPWAEVWIDGDSLGITPLGVLSLAEGEHQVRLRHPVLPEHILSFQIKPEKQTILEIDLYQVSARLEVTAVPWGYLWLDDDSLGLLPRSEPIWVKPGLHKIRVKHPTLLELTDSINVTADAV
ncbi:MAG: serine/threonine-protein kinase, partial [Calditrichota bacterium]